MGLNRLIWQTSTGANALALMSAELPARPAPSSSARGESFGSIVLTPSAPVSTTPASMSAARGDVAEPRGSTRVLLVDDHLDTLATLQRMLQRHGYDVVAVASVVEAMQWVERNLATPDQRATPFDVLVSDIGLPDGDGCGLLRQLRDRFDDVRAVALSGYGMDVDRRASAAAGFAMHLVKPTGVQQLVEALKQVLASAPATS